MTKLGVHPGELGGLQQQRRKEVLVCVGEWITKTTPFNFVDNKICENYWRTYHVHFLGGLEVGDEFLGVGLEF